MSGIAVAVAIFLLVAFIGGVVLGVVVIVSVASRREDRLFSLTGEAPDAVCRGFVFHDEAWHWAMLALHGNMYWHARPDLVWVPQEYRQEATRFPREKASG